MITPGYPFSARDIFGDLRSRLAAEHRRPMSFERLARMLGRSKSTTYNWFDIYHHPHVLGFLCLLERLPPAERQSFIEAHCRAYPTLEDPRLAHAPGKAAKLLELLDQKAGLTIITGGTDFSRAFVFTALAHTASRADGKLPAAAGIDLHRSNLFVPVESLIYIAEDLGPDHARRLTQRIWPRVLTSGAPRLFDNRVWSSVPFLVDVSILVAAGRARFSDVFSLTCRANMLISAACGQGMESRTAPGGRQDSPQGSFCPCLCHFVPLSRHFIPY